MSTRNAMTAVTLEDKYTVSRGRVLINGVQALVRLPLLQKALDRLAGLNTAGYISGYRGSPLGGLDMTLARERTRLEQNDIVFRPGVNEDLAMTAMWGTQILKTLPDPKFDGVFAYWYAKGPGVDRSGDPLKHGNYAGTNRNGGVLVVYGDDHPGKSSTVSHQSEQALAANSVPTLYPANVGEFIEFGLKGWALSRYSGLWVGFKTVNETVEQTATVDLDLDNFHIERPERGELAAGAVNIDSGEIVWPPVKSEIAVTRIRIPLAHRFARANGIDRVTLRSSRPKLGIVTAGKAFMDVEQALQMLGIDTARANALGLSIYKVGMIWPVEPEGLKAFAADQQELFFVEEKKAFMEEQAARILYNEARRPVITGKFDPHGNKLLESDVQLEPLLLARAIVQRLEALGAADDALQARLRLLQPPQEKPGAAPALMRAPYFCSGCPHNTSTKVPEGSIAMAGIGCHAMAVFTRRDTLPPSHMGGEGAQWTGLHHFTNTQHVFQNLGDGTYYHSGLSCIRNSVASGANITYKILYNDAVAMTGGQPFDGPISVGQIAQQVLAEGIVELVLVSDDPDKLKTQAGLPAGVEVLHRDEMPRLQERLRKVEGCTVIIYEQTCAAEKRRRRKRGTYPDPAKRVVINEEVCEGCADCSTQATCVSIQPKFTPKGVKRQIDQSSCNKDYSCNRGFCPSFITVYGGELRKPKAMDIGENLFADLPRPAGTSLDNACGVMVAGIGGTGVVTVTAVLGMAAHLDGKACSIYDMTGLSQKNGAVYSHLKIAADVDQLGAQKLGLGDADLLMAFDLVAGVGDEAFRTLGEGRSRVLGNSAVQTTVSFQFNPRATIDERMLEQRLSGRVGADRADFVDATGIAMTLTGNTIASNMFMVGYAMQKGLLPLSIEAVRRAIELNGVAVPFNLRAFGLGRLYAHDPSQLAPHLVPPQQARDARPQTLADALRHGQDWLTRYQNAAYAQRYSSFVDEIATAEREALAGSEAFSVAVANNLAKLMAYKDEYEVARLHSEPAMMERIRSQFDGDFKVKFNLAPPLFAKRDPETGNLKKSEYGGWMMVMFRNLARFRFLRGTAFDVFGYTAERKTERGLIDDYMALMREVAAELTAENHEFAVKLASIPEEIKGFGHVKERNIELAKRQQETLIEQFRSGPAELARTGT